MDKIRRVDLSIALKLSCLVHGGRRKREQEVAGKGRHKQDGLERYWRPPSIMAHLWGDYYHIHCRSHT